MARLSARGDFVRPDLISLKKSGFSPAARHRARCDLIPRSEARSIALATMLLLVMALA
ncbi:MULTISPECIES: hypothetical protein [unclassified Haematospirillum]|uniref:hypothetical protein n=1 Tax=unclassified Haematospirillum TaxID=2622088 RepID=UPI00143B6D44|nr:MULTISPECIES: hypothetical protein [unclassified Haematospirillum]NKD54275.1 hypothetical protein [Haematospirillum sp. H4890]NKD87010.1 hypothetical protein [Haematospirillum sp. 15-248]